METIYEALRESHDMQRALCRSLVRIKSTERAREVFDALRIELASHAAAEERFLYAPILMDDRGLSPSRHALAEHHKIDECVEDICTMLDPCQGNWLEAVKKLSHEVHHHLKEEEKRFFQASGKILTDSQKVQLAKRYRRDLARMRKVLLAQDG